MLKEDSCLVYREGKFQAAVFVLETPIKIQENGSRCISVPADTIIDTCPVTGKMTVMAYIANYGEFSKFQEMQ